MTGERSPLGKAAVGWPAAVAKYHSRVRIPSLSATLCYLVSVESTIGNPCPYQVDRLVLAREGARER